MSYNYYFGTYKKPVFELIEKGKIDQALTFIEHHRSHDDLYDQHRAELYVLEAQCYQALNDLRRSEAILALAKQEIDVNNLRGAIVCFYYCTKAEEMIIRNQLQTAVKYLKLAEEPAETDCQRGIIELDFGFINYRQGFFKASSRYAKKARRLLKDDCGLLNENCRALVKYSRKKHRLLAKILPKSKPHQPSKFKKLVTIGAE